LILQPQGLQKLHILLHIPYHGLSLLKSSELDIPGILRPQSVLDCKFNALAFVIPLMSSLPDSQQCACEWETSHFPRVKLEPGVSAIIHAEDVFYHVIGISKEREDVSPTTGRWEILAELRCKGDCTVVGTFQGKVREKWVRG
jgi:hypothetical protein